MKLFYQLQLQVAHTHTHRVCVRHVVQEKVQNVIELHVADVYLKILIANRRCLAATTYLATCNVCNIYFQSCHTKVQNV